MQKIKKLLALGLSCLALGASMFFASCKTYDCATCKDTGIIDCPNCHVQKCHYVEGGYSCDKGAFYRKCSKCDGSGTTEQICWCVDWYYDRYRGKPNCTTCKGRGSYRRTCITCNGTGRIKLNTSSCPKCVNGYIGGEKCADKSCIVPDDTSKNNGYSYIICPDCGE